MRKTSDTEKVERFWSHVAKGDGCWQWRLKPSQKGYGRFAVHGRKTVYAHRFLWQLLYGAIPNGLCICHHCDNPICVRPDHLFIGTHKDNAQDRDKKGRGGDISGFKHPLCKVTTSDVKKIRALAQRTTLTQECIGVLFGVSQQAISRIVIGATYQCR